MLIYYPLAKCDKYIQNIRAQRKRLRKFRHNLYWYEFMSYHFTLCINSAFVVLIFHLHRIFGGRRFFFAFGVAIAVLFTSHHSVKMYTISVFLW